MDGNGCDVVILCGGLGKRLRPVVSDRPKPMAEIGGKPFVQLLVEHIGRFGFRRFVLGAGYKAEMIADHFKAVSLPFEIKVAVEHEPLGTGGGLRNVRGLLDADTVLALNGDSFCSVDYRRIVEGHLARAADATVAVVPVPDAGAFGSIIMDGTGMVTAFNEKQSGGQGLVNAGVYVFRSSVIRSLPETTPLSLEKDVFPQLIGRLFGHKVDGPLFDIGTPESYRLAQQALPVLMCQEPR
ncbi:MAG: nucleotidyltransferase family protein [bacterium]